MKLAARCPFCGSAKKEDVVEGEGGGFIYRRTQYECGTNGAKREGSWVEIFGGVPCRPKIYSLQYEQTRECCKAELKLARAQRGRGTGKKGKKK